MMTREDLTAIPHAKCTCGHTDDMHYAVKGELDAWDKKRCAQARRRIASRHARAGANACRCAARNGT